LDTYVDPFFARSNDPLKAAKAYVLAWISALDGEVDQQEMEYLRTPRTLPHGLTTEELMKRVNHRSAKRTATAIRLVAESLDQRERTKFLELAILVTLADGRIHQSELHAIGLLADAFRYGSYWLKALFKQVSGRSMPEPGDPSSTAWWVGKGEGSSRDRQQDRDQSDDEYRERQREQRNEQHEETRARTATHDVAWARGVLGVDDQATHDEIRKQFNLMSKSTHPDRFATVGDECVSAANVLFRNVREAYEILKENA